MILYHKTEKMAIEKKNEIGEMILAVPDGFEPSIATFREWCDDQLRYGTIMVGGGGNAPPPKTSKDSELLLF